MNRIITIVLIGCLILPYVGDVYALAPGSGFTGTDEWKPQSLEDLEIESTDITFKIEGNFSLGFTARGKNGTEYWVKFARAPRYCAYIPNEWAMLDICKRVDNRIVQPVCIGVNSRIHTLSDSEGLSYYYVIGYPYIIFEKLDGECLEEYILRRRDTIPEEEQLDIAKQAAEIMMAVHGAGIIHRDFAMRNLWREPDGRIRLFDFALSWFDGKDAPPDIRKVGHNTSERVINGYGLQDNELPDKQYDIFSFGVFLVELFRNVILFNESDLNRNITSLAVANIVTKCIGNRRIRYTDFSEVLRDLNRLIPEREKERAVPESA